MVQKVALLTAGGFAPCLSSAIGGLIGRYTEVAPDVEIIAYKYGYQGLLTGDYLEVTPEVRAKAHLLHLYGGSPIGNSRVKLTNAKDLVKRGLVAEGDDPLKVAADRLVADGVDVLHTIGGDDTNTTAADLAAYLASNDYGLTVVGLPKTIDNDLAGTDYTFGFDTAVSIAAEAIDRLRTTGDSHRRCMVLEVMGRDVGWIALHSGMAGGAQAMLIPEFPESIEQVCEWVTSVRDRGRSSLVVVAEGFKLLGEDQAVTREGLDGFGRPRLGGVAEVLAPLIEQRTGIEARATVLGHVQRGGSPTAFDRVLATRTGIAGADAVLHGEWGTMAGLHGDAIKLVPLEEAVGKLKTVPAERYAEARLNFG